MTTKPMLTVAEIDAMWLREDEWLGTGTCNGAREAFASLRRMARALAVLEERRWIASSAHDRVYARALYEDGGPLLSVRPTLVEAVEAALKERP